MLVQRVEALRLVMQAGRVEVAGQIQREDKIPFGFTRGSWEEAIEASPDVKFVFWNGEPPLVVPTPFLVDRDLFYRLTISAAVEGRKGGMNFIGWTQREETLRPLREELAGLRWARAENDSAPVNARINEIERLIAG